MAAVDVVTILGAFLVIVVGVAMLHLFKELQVSGSRRVRPGPVSSLGPTVSVCDAGDAEGAGLSAVPAGGGGSSLSHCRRTKKEDEGG